MANNIVPAVVLFSIALGLALMGIEKKGPIIAAFDVLEEALKRVMKFIVRLTPIGIFAIAASTAGTMSVDQLSRLAGLYRRLRPGHRSDEVLRAPGAHHAADAAALPRDRRWPRKTRCYWRSPPTTC